MDAAGDRISCRTHIVKSLSGIHVATIISPEPVEIFEALSRRAMAAASNLNDPYLQYVMRFAVTWEEIHRGRMVKARAAADESVAVGRRMNDPRSIGVGMATQAWIAMVSDDYETALGLAEASVDIARTPYDLEPAKYGTIAARVLLGRPEAVSSLRDWMEKCRANDWLWYLGSAEGLWGLALVFHGEI